MSYLLFASFIIIGNLVNVLFRKSTLQNLFIGLFLVWPLFFSISTTYFHSYSIVSGTFIVLFCLGVVYLFLKKNYWQVFFTSLFVVSLLLLIQFIPQFSADLDSKNYLLYMSRFNFDSWGKVCDKVLRIPGLTEHGYYMRLPFISYGWAQNIFSIPLNPASAYIHSTLFYIFSILFLPLIT